MTARLHLTFAEHLLHEPVLYRLGRDFDLVINLRRANIDEDSGWVIVEVEGTEEALASAVAWLTDRGVQVDRIAEDSPP